MTGEWREVTLGDVAEIVMGQSPSGDTVTAESGFPLLNGPTEFGAHHPTPVQFTTDARRFAQLGDLLFCVRGSTTGRMNWADELGGPRIRHWSWSCSNSSQERPSFATLCSWRNRTWVA